jgi:large subunit ribosomal protein L10
VARTEIRPEKIQAVEELADKLTRSNLVVLTDFRGLKVSELGELRRRLRPAGVDYQVAKNTLTRIAAERVGRDAIVQDLEGPTALAFAFQDPVDAAKALNDYARTGKTFSIKGALLGDRRLAAEEVRQLADLPPREVIRAQVVGAIQGPLASVVGSINALLTNVVFAIDQRAQHMESA